MIHKLILIIIISLFITFESYSQDLEEPHLYVFVGEKISVNKFEPELKEGQILMDAAYQAKYKVLDQVYNDLEVDTLEFKAYDHFGDPAFSNFKHVLLYIIETVEGYFHEKYLYSPVYLTKNGDWAGPYSLSDYNHPNNQEITIEPVLVDWEATPSFQYENASLEAINESFPAPYYKIKDKTVSAIYGNDIQELFLLKKNGYLKARGYFN